MKLFGFYFLSTFCFLFFVFYFLVLILYFYQLIKDFSNLEIDLKRLNPLMSVRSKRPHTFLK